MVTIFSITKTARIVKSVLALSAVFSTAAWSAETIVIPTSVELAPESGVVRFGEPNAIINGSGLTGGVPYVDGQVVPEQWDTVDLHGSGGRPDGVADWFTVHSVLNGEPVGELALEFELDGFKTLSGVVLWAYNSDGGFKERGVDALSVFVSTDGGETWLLAETFAPREAYAQATEEAQVLRFSSGVYRANAIKIIGTTTTTNNPSIDEILFLEDESIVPRPRDVIVVPESVTLAPESGPVRNGSIDAIIDGSGLSAGVPYIDGDPVPGSWDTVKKHGSGGGTDWVEVRRKLNGVLTEGVVAEFQLSGLREVAGAVVWNYNGDGGWARRGLDDIDIYTSQDSGATWTFAETINPNDGSGTGPEPAQVLPFLQGPYLANAIKIAGKSTAESHALDEILFYEDNSISSIASQPVPVTGAPIYASLSSLEWQPPLDDRIALIDGYDIYLGRDSTVTNNPVFTTTSESLPVVLEEGQTYYWRVDTRVTRFDGTQELLEGEAWEFRTLPAQTTDNLNPSPSWYVGNTEAGEWLEYKKVYFAKGSYRFTGHFGAVEAGNTVTLTLNGQALDATEVPVTTSFENFELVHMGQLALDEGYYDIKLTFDTGNVSSDMVYVRRSIDTSSYVVDDDIASPLPSPIDGTAVSAISYASGQTKFPFCPKPYSFTQCKAWYRHDIYNYSLSDDSLYARIDEQVASRQDFAWLHGKLSKNKNDWGYDRDYIPENGNGSSSKNNRLLEVLEEHPYGDYIKYGYFVDNLIYGQSYKGATGNLADWDDPDYHQWLWENWTKPWFDVMPPERLYKKDGYVYVNLWTAECFGCTKWKETTPYVVDLKARIKAEYGYDTRVIVSKSFVRHNPGIAEHVYGVQNWFGWWGSDNVTHATLNGVTSSFATNGRRLPLPTIWEPDWDPATNTGTRRNTQYSDNGNYLSPHTDGVSDFRAGLEYADSIGSEWMMLEAWGNILEGTAWFRSDHPDNQFPNEFVNIAREFADKQTAAIMLQSEAADYFYDTTPGNAGKAYRYNWQTESEVDLDIFRPRRRIHGFEVHPNPPADIAKLAGGNTDIWSLSSDGSTIIATEMDGNEKWGQASTKGEGDSTLAFSELDLGMFAWGISNGDLYKSNLPIGFKPWFNKRWEEQPSNGNMVDLALNITRNQVWAVDQDGQVWLGDQDQNVAGFTPVGDKALVQIAAGEHFVWGIEAVTGDLLVGSAEANVTWANLPNTHNFVELKIGSGEVWALTANGDLYRNSESGAGFWEMVTSEVTSVAPAREFVWLRKFDGTVEWSKVTGFAETVNPDMDADGILNEQDSCPTQDVSGNIVVLGRETLVADRVNDSGCAISSQVNTLFDNAMNTTTSKGMFISTVLKGLQSMLVNGQLTTREWFALRVLSYQIPYPQ